MKPKRYGVIFGAIALTLLFLSGSALYAGTPRGETFSPHTLAPARASAANSAHPIIVEPRDGVAPILQMIAGATSTIDIVMYQFEDRNIEQALARKAGDGVRVRVILDNGYFGDGSRSNEIAFDYLRSHDVAVRWSPQYFALTHEKSIVVDGTEALIMTFNLVPRYYATGRDFGVIETDSVDIAAMEDAFESDWGGRTFTAKSGSDLVWSPGSRDVLLGLIAGARTSLRVYNEEMQDQQIIDALSQAARSGVNVEIVMTYSKNWKAAFETLSAAGVHVRTYKHSASLYIHAKVIVADNARAFIGSENFSSTSLDQNRELGIVLSDRAAIEELAHTFARDWQDAAPFYPR